MPPMIFLVPWVSEQIQVEFHHRLREYRWEEPSEYCQWWSCILQTDWSMWRFQVRTWQHTQPGLLRGREVVFLLSSGQKSCSRPWPVSRTWQWETPGACQLMILIVQTQWPGRMWGHWHLVLDIINFWYNSVKRRWRNFLEFNMPEQE